MPVVFKYEGYRFHFFANEGNPREPIHIHVTRAGADARTIRRLQTIVDDRRGEIEEAWNEFFA